MREKWLRAGFYQVAVQHDPPRTFEEILQRFTGDIPEDERRTLEPDDSAIRLQFVRHVRTLWTGEMLRIRRHEDLTKARTNGHQEQIQFDPDEASASRRRFLSSRNDARWIVQLAREAGAHEALTEYLITSLRSCIFLAAGSATALFFSPQPPQWWHGYALATWLGLAGFASLAVWRVLRLMSIILRSVSRSG